MKKKSISITLILLILLSCSKSNESVSGKKDEYWDPNLRNQIEKKRNEGGGILGDINKVGKSSRD